jgi:hypothetical protein
MLLIEVLETDRCLNNVVPDQIPRYPRTTMCGSPRSHPPEGHMSLDFWLLHRRGDDMLRLIAEAYDTG